MQNLANALDRSSLEVFFSDGRQVGCRRREGMRHQNARDVRRVCSDLPGYNAYYEER